MDYEAKIGLLDKQIDAAKAGDPPDFNLWRQTTDVVLRNVLGDTNPLYRSFTNISYSLGIWTSSTPRSSFESARRRGVSEAIAILNAAKTEVQLTGGSPTPTDSKAAVGKRYL